MMRWSAALKRVIHDGSLASSFLALISGTVASQAILFLFSPFLSRVFDPVDFGNLANYNAWVAVLGLISNLRYEHAMFVAPGRAGMNRVVALAIILSLISVFAYGLVAALIYAAGPTTGYLGEIRGIVVFIPLGILPAVISSPLIQFGVRKGNFRTLAAISLLQVACTLGVQIALGLLHIPNGLVIGALAGSMVACAFYVALHFRRNSVYHVRREMTFVRLAGTALEYVNFPRYTLPADVMGTVVQQFVPVLLTAMFSPAIAGLYAFSMRVVRVPLLVISTSVSTVLRKQAGDHLRNEGNLAAVFSQTVKGLSLLALGPFVILAVFATQLFVAVFGNKWRDAGTIVRILTPGIVLEFIAFPLLALFIVTQTQRYTFRIQLASVVLLFAALIGGRFYWNGFLATCALMSAAMIVTNGSTILMAYVVSRRARVSAVEAPA